MKEQTGRGPTTLGARLVGFAAGHFILSALGVGLGIVALPLLRWGWATAALTVLLMLAYFPLGAYVAWESDWTAPAGDRERLLAVLQPALVAWTWAAVVLGILFFGQRDELFLLAFYGSLLLASPSSAFVLLCMVLASAQDPDGVLWWVAVAFLAGLLPPLLFALGSFWQSGWAGKTPTPPPQSAGRSTEDL